MNRERYPVGELIELQNCPPDDGQMTTDRNRLRRSWEVAEFHKVM